MIDGIEIGNELPKHSSKGHNAETCHKPVDQPALFAEQPVRIMPVKYVNVETGIDENNKKTKGDEPGAC